VDHFGADLYELDHLDLTEIGTVEGDQVQADYHTKGDQAGYQRRVEAIYQRNADMIARQITERAATAGARLVLLTGDDRESASVTDHLDTHRFTVVTVQAGARHDQHLTDRLRHAANEQSQADRRSRRARAVEHLREELGRHALGVEGRQAAATAVAEGRVDTMFVDRSASSDECNELARDTLLSGGAVVVTSNLDTADGVAALLRYATH
jgi:stalled ribosome rescue protein Dom34